jgi:hypothetical protein
MQVFTNNRSESLPRLIDLGFYQFIILEDVRQCILIPWNQNPYLCPGIDVVVEYIHGAILALPLHPDPFFQEPVFYPVLQQAAVQ